MHRTTLAIATLAVTLALVGACKHGDGQTAGVTTIRSGTPEGVRVTNTPAPNEPTTKDLEANRIATAFCGHERKCMLPEGSESSTEAGLLGEAVCVAELEPVARSSIDSWKCSPAVARAGLKDCIAAVNPEIRCRDVLIGEASPVEECRPTNICRKGQGITLR
jgi:hypothetical protein